MLKIKVYNIDGDEVGEEKLNSQVFGIKVKEELVQEAVVAARASRRKVLAHTKGRSEVRGGGRKPWRQKGTGRARHGSIRSPLWRGGGITFGPTKERNFPLKINKKAKRKALFMTLSDKVAYEKMIILNRLELEKPKTKKMLEIIENLSSKVKKDLNKGTLIILPTKDEIVIKSARNIPKFNILRVQNINILDILKYEYLLMPLETVRKIEETYTRTQE